MGNSGPDMEKDFWMGKTTVDKSRVGDPAQKMLNILGHMQYLAILLKEMPDEKNCMNNEWNDDRQQRCTNEDE